MYYAEGTDNSEVETAQAGMGFLPLLLPVLAGVLGVGAQLLQKKPKAPKGPTKEQILAMQQAAAADEKRKMIKYGLIGLAAVVVIGGGIYLARRKSK
jgi:cobalamin biosynthesis Mg chelatase CobN